MHHDSNDDPDAESKVEEPVAVIERNELREEKGERRDFSRILEYESDGKDPCT